MIPERRVSASSVVCREGKVLLVRHTYGAAKGKYLIPGGFCEEGEMPEQAAEREVYEETGLTVSSGSLIAVRFTTDEVWCIFEAEYVSGEPQSDGQENDSAIFWDIEELLASQNVVETTKELIRNLIAPGKQRLRKSSFINKKYNEDTWQLYL